VKSELRWCVGKFIYSRGAESPMHFMPLQDFTLVDFLEQSRLFGLRAMRKGLSGKTGLVDSLARLTENEVFACLAETTLRLFQLPSRERGATPRVVEYSPSVGPVFEYFKLMAETLRSAGGTDAFVRVNWTGIGPQAFRMKFEILHADEESQATYYSDNGATVADWTRLCQEADVAVFNHYQAVREIDPVALPLKECLLATNLAQVFAAYVVQGTSPSWRTTVKGKDVLLPAREDLETMLVANDPTWRFFWCPGYDEKFFLPEDGPRTGLLFGCTGRTETVSPVLKR
jgi:hypothetical protein